MTLNVVLAVLEVREDNVAHYAFIDENNIVTEVIVGKDEGEEGIDWEQHYQQFRPGMTCKQTSYNTKGGVHLNGGIPLRKNYAGIGYTYDSVRDAFIPPKPFSSWILNEETCLWESPIPHPFEKIKILQEQRDIRYDICKNCEWLSTPLNICNKCGCFMAVKTYMPHQSCPIGKWNSITIEGYSPGQNGYIWDELTQTWAPIIRSTQE
jgi:hypothetical protein